MAEVLLFSPTYGNPAMQPVFTQVNHFSHNYHSTCAPYAFIHHLCYMSC